MTDTTTNTTTVAALKAAKAKEKAGAAALVAPAKTTEIRLWSPEPDGCHIGLTSGHTMYIPNDPENGVVVEKRFRKQAIARGCLPVGMSEEDVADEAVDRNIIIRTSMEKMLESDEPNTFTGDGKPALAKLNQLCGFNVERSERDRVWAELETALADPKNED